MLFNTLLEAQGFTVGIPEGGTEWSDKQIRGASKNIASVLKLASVAVPAPLIAAFVKAGASAEDTRAILTPFVERCDLFALQMQHQPNLFLLIYADTLTPGEIIERLKFFYGKADKATQFGIRLVFEKQAITTVWVHPVLVFFDPAQKVSKWNEVRPEGWKGATDVVLQTGCIDVTAREIEWTSDQRWTGGGWVGRLANTVNSFGRKVLKLDNAALQSILQAAKVPAKTAAKRRAAQA